jgi:DNA-binding transcriptional MerR regulator
MDGDPTLYTIGDLARRTSLTVRTIRFYSDEGLVPPATRSPAGYRLYDLDALARLDLVRTLRDLDIDLGTTRRVLARELTVAEVAAVHADALDAQIRTLRLRRAVLRAVAKRGSDPKELELMHKLAKLSDEERRQIISDFYDEAFDGLDIDPGFAAKMRSAMPELPDDPSPEQVDAWVELAELVRDPDFRASVRGMAQRHAADLASGADRGDSESWQQAEVAVNERAGAAVAAGIDPASAEGIAVVTEIVTVFATAYRRTDGPEFRSWLAERIETGSDPRAERYFHLLGAVNGWPPKESVIPRYEWLIAALRAAS